MIGTIANRAGSCLSQFASTNLTGTLQMLFSDLMKMDYNPANNVVDLQEIIKALPNTPQQVASQVYSEHGRLAKYQERYGAINISELKWQLVQKTAAEICAASRQFEGHVESVAKRAQSFAKEGWKCIGHSEEAIASWQANKTWRTDPVFFSGRIAGIGESLRLVEGHTRLGTLCGLVMEGVISSDSLHSIWLGE